MKYTTEITIEVPLEEFIKKLVNPNNLKYWQKDLKSYEHISGSPDSLGNKTKLIYRVNKREVELIETITYIDLPHEIHRTYETKGILNIQKNKFLKTSEGHTTWINNNVFTPTSFLSGTMLFLMPRSFKKQSEKYLQDFKIFAENKKI